jgi:hypothetical protein
VVSVILKAIFSATLAGVLAYFAHWLAVTTSNSNTVGFVAAIPTFIGAFYVLSKTTWSQIIGNILDGLGSL